MGWRRRNKIHAEIITLFRFTRHRKFLPAERPTEPETIPKLGRPRDAAPPRIFSPEDMATLLNHVPKEWVPYVALGGFAGLRQAEILLLCWEHIFWEDATIYIPEEVAKRTTRKNGDVRYVPMPPNLVAWLQPWLGSSGRLYATQRPDNEQRKWKQFIADGVWGKNPLRHSWLSYRTAETGSLSLVTGEAGNSPSPARNHHLNPRMCRQAVQWFSIVPQNEPANVVRVTLGS